MKALHLDCSTCCLCLLVLPTVTTVTTELIITPDTDTGQQSINPLKESNIMIREERILFIMS